MGKILIFKVKEKGRKDSIEYKNKVNLYDPNQISQVLDDLKNMFDAPVKKACIRFMNNADKILPFS